MKTSLCCGKLKLSEGVLEFSEIQLWLLLCSCGDKPTKSMQKPGSGSRISSGFSLLISLSPSVPVFIWVIELLTPHGISLPCHITGADQESWEESKKKREPVVELIVARGTQIPPFPMLHEFWTPSLALAPLMGIYSCFRGQGQGRNNIIRWKQRFCSEYKASYTWLVQQIVIWGFSNTN